MAFGIKSIFKLGKKAVAAPFDVLIKQPLKQLGDILAPDINIPAAPTPKVMPIPDQLGSIAAKRRKRAMAKSGRSTSILSGGDTLG